MGQGGGRHISDAYASGRLTSEEFEHRSGQALAARTYGELDDVLLGLGELDRAEPPLPRKRLSARQVAYWFGGLVLLAAFLPVLFALHRWAWPRSANTE